MEQSSRDRSRGFTWLEMLIVIAICVFVICVLFPCGHQAVVTTMVMGVVKVT